MTGRTRWSRPSARPGSGQEEQAALDDERNTMEMSAEFHVRVAAAESIMRTHIDRTANPCAR